MASHHAEVKDYIKSSCGKEFTCIRKFELLSFGFPSQNGVGSINRIIAGNNMNPIEQANDE
jgi:hypothetical protein